MESSVQFICVFCGSLSDEYGCPCSTCKLCGNDAHYGYYCPSQVPFVYNQDPCFNQNLDNFPQTSLSFPQQYLCCEDCGGPHATFECQPMNQSFYNSNSSGFDQIQPPQYSVVHQSPQETDMEMNQAREDLMEAIQAFLKKYNHIPPKEKCMALALAEERFLKVKQAFEEEQNQLEIIQELLLQLIHDLQRLAKIQPKQAEEKGINKQVQKKQEEKSIAELLAEEQAATINSLYQNPDLLQIFIYQDDDNDDDDYDEESILSMNTDMFETPSPDAITTSTLIEEPKDSLIIEDEDINTILEKESDEENESSVENLFHIPSESKATSDNESECDFPIFDDSPLDIFKDNCVIFSRPLFDSYGDSTSSEYSSDNESFLEEDIDPLLEELAGELALINLIPPGIARADFDPEGDISLVEKLLYDKSSPRPLEELNSENSDTMIESFSSSPIPVKDSDSLMKEIDIFLVTDDSIPPGIDSDGYDSEEDNLFLEYESDPGELTRVVVEDISGEPEVHIPNVLPTHPTLCQDLDFTLSTDFSGSDLVVSFPFKNRNKTFDPGISIEVQSKRFLSLNKCSISFISNPLSLPFSSEIEDKVFNHGILISKEKKSPHLLSHQGFKVFKIIHNFLNESPVMIYGGDMPILDVPYLHFYPP
ncbi:hypothetical protein Tco_0890799 [Tanacetum coccineum]|uniref:Uncharacterized protein n=1 Tax=Tanacetum coccineum TaxID=301880 RepID=A0ABQ5C4E8_9ASTR